MAANNIQNPHDALFKSMCTDVGIAIDLLRKSIPAELFASIELDTLTPTDKSFISKELRHSASDMVYQVKIRGHEGYLCFLLEHQSTDDKLMAFRKLEYNVSIMRQHLKQGAEALPIIINICIYHGEKSPYPHSTDLFDCFSDPQLAKRWMFKPFHLIDLTIMPEAEIDACGKAALLGFLFKHCREAAFSREVKRLAALLRRIEAEFHLETVLHYLAQACGEHDDPHRLLDQLIQALPEQEKTIMTYGQQLIQEGMQLGMQQGVQQGIRQGMQQGVQQGLQEGAKAKALAIAARLLQNGLSVGLIAESTGLSLQEVQAIKQSLTH